MKQPNTASAETSRSREENSVVEENFTTKKDSHRSVRHDIADSLCSQQQHRKIDEASASKVNMIEPWIATRYLGKKYSDNGETKHSAYYNGKSAVLMKTRAKQDEIETGNDRIVRQISDHSVFRNDSFADHPLFKQQFANGNPYDKDLIYDDESSRTWESDNPVIAQSDEDNAADYVPTYLPILTDQKINPGSLYYISDIAQEDPIFNQLGVPSIDRPKENVHVDEIELSTDDSISSNLDLTQILTSSESSILDSQFQVAQIPAEVLRYQDASGASRLHLNLSNKPETIKAEVEVLYPEAKGSMSARHFLRKVPGTLNVYIEENAPLMVTPEVSKAYDLATRQPIRKINDRTLNLPQSIPRRPVEHILIPVREKTIEQNQYENDAVGNRNTGAREQSIIKEGHEIKQEASRILHERHRSGNKAREEPANAKSRDSHSSATTADAENQRVNLSTALNKTKEVASQILEKIIDELEEIKSDRIENKQVEGYYLEL